MLTQPVEITLRDQRVVHVLELTPDHAAQYRAYIERLTTESPWIGVQHHEVDDVETKKGKIAKLQENPGGLSIGVFDDQSVLVGDLFYSSPTRDKTKHVAYLGIALLECYRGVGLGRAMMEFAIRHASENSQILKIELGVFDSNTAAVGLYESMGFVVEGRLAKKFRQPDGTFYDEILMGLWLGRSIRQKPDKDRPPRFLSSSG